MSFGAMLGSFGLQLGGSGGLSFRFWSLFGVYVGSCRAQMGVWQAQRPQGRGLEGLGLAQGRLGTRIWGPTLGQLEPSWSQLGSSMDPT